MLTVVGVLTALAPRVLADEKKTPAEKAAADWLYPEAKVVSSDNASGEVFGVVQETADDIPKILEHYKHKLHVALDPESAAQSGTTGAGAEITVAYFSAHLKPGAAGGTAIVCTFKTQTEVTTLLLCRPPDGKVTTVTIGYVPLKTAK